MKTNFLLIAAVGVTTFLTSCGETKAPEAKEEAPVELAEQCTYEYNNDATEVRWTAYKHTAKVGVKGGFDVFKNEAGKKGATPEEVLAGLGLTIDVPSINSNDSLRDQKLVKHFFNQMVSTTQIVGSISSIEAGKGTMKMTLNEVEKEVPFIYTVTENKVELKSTIDILAFNAPEALASLNKACEEKHTGGDGETKLWSEVAIYITTELNKDCK